MSVLIIKSDVHTYKVNTIVPNLDYLAIHCESYSETGVPQNLYAVRFPMMSQCLYLRDNVEENQVLVPLTFQIVENELGGAANYLYMCHKDELPLSIEIRPSICFNNFLPSQVRELLKAGFNNPVTN